MDVLHWTTHVYPRTNAQKWPVGKISSCVTVDRLVRTGAKSRGRKRNVNTLDTMTLPPSIRRRLNDVLTVTESVTWLAKLPCVRTEEDAQSLAPMWASVLANVSEPAVCESVPISLSSHDDRMLQYGRDVPLCALGEDSCAAMQFPGNQGPLPIYVMPAVQDLLDQGLPPPRPFSCSATCLLCIRRDVHAAVLAWSSMIANSNVQIHRGACIPPPFANLRDVPGGYISKAMVTDQQQNVFGPVSIVGSHRSLRCCYNPETSHWFFDQSSIKVNSPSFLCPGTTATTC